MTHASIVNELDSLQKLRGHLEYGLWAQAVMTLMVVCKDFINRGAKKFKDKTLMDSVRAFMGKRIK